MEPLLVEQRGTVRWLLLNRPERRNALDITLIEALDKQITSAEADPGTAVIAVAGRGPSFCAGGDFHQFLELHERGDNPVDFLADVSARFSRIAASPPQLEPRQTPRPAIPCTPSGTHTPNNMTAPRNSMA